jgi:hypothetical protein
MWQTQLHDLLVLVHLLAHRKKHAALSANDKTNACSYNIAPASAAMLCSISLQE